MSASTVSSKQTKRQSRPSLNRLNWLKIIVHHLISSTVDKCLAVTSARHADIRNQTGVDKLSVRYRMLLRALRWVKKRPVNQSLDDYAQAIDKRLGQQAHMFNLTKAYEETVFGNLPRLT